MPKSFRKLSGDWKQSPLKQPIKDLENTKKDIGKAFKVVNRFANRRGL